jgi:ATP-dependent DNA helicase 2 subunit 2
VLLVPKRVAKTRKDGHQQAQDDDEETLLLDKKGPVPPRSKSQSQIAMQSQRATTQTAGSDTEPEEQDVDMVDVNAEKVQDEDEEGWNLLEKKKGPSSSRKGKSNHLPTPARSLSPEATNADDTMDIDVDIPDGIAPGRIIGTVHPLQDFKKNLETGDVVTKAFEDLGDVVIEIIGKPSASRRHEEMIGCMREMRSVALREDEIDAWNKYVRGADL